MGCTVHIDVMPDSKVHGANMGPTWGRQDPGGPHVGHVNLAIWDAFVYTCVASVGSFGILSSNMGFQKSTWQTSTDYGGSSSRAVDGCDDTDFDNGCCSHTGWDDFAAWGVDLGEQTGITYVDVTTRNICEQIN